MNLRLRLAVLAVLALLVGAAAVTAVQMQPGTAVAVEAPAVVIHDSSWDGDQQDSWSAFTVSLSSPSGFVGELRLAPIGLQGAGPPEPPAPSVRARLDLDPGAERLMSVMAPVGEVAYQAEVRDVAGHLVSAGLPTSPGPRSAYDVGLLSERRYGDADIEVGPHLPLSISRRFRSAVDFPSDALSLEGLEVIVIADFDSGTLSPNQRGALEDFVALGGTLLTTGGTRGGPTVASLPEVLVPLSPEGTASASLAPLTDLVGITVDAGTIVTTGPLRSGRVALSGISGPPLIVEAAYGLGVIVQLTYDPYAVSEGPLSRDQLADQPTATALQGLAWSAGLVRALAGLGAHPSQVAGQSAAPPARGWAALDEVPTPRPSTGGPAGLLLLAYPLMMGGAARVLGKRPGRRHWRWAAVPGLAVVVSTAIIPVGWGLRASALTGDEVTIERSSSTGSPARVESFHRLVPSARHNVDLRVGRATLATTAAGPPRPLVLPSVPPEGGPPPGPGGDIVTLDRETRVELTNLVGWKERRLHTLSMSEQGGSLQARLALRAGRLVGTVTNTGGLAVRRVRAQAADGARAELAAEVAPGATVEVDAPLEPGPPTGGDVEAGALEAVVASGAGKLKAGELALVGLLPGRPSLAGMSRYRNNTVHRVAATTVRVEAADDFLLGFGAPKAVCCGTTNGAPGVYEFLMPTGMAGPFTVAQPKRQLSNYAVEPEIYDWSTGAWRFLPIIAGAKPIAASEINDGIVRIRAGIHVPDAGFSVIADTAEP